MQKIGPALILAASMAAVAAPSALAYARDVNDSADSMMRGGTMRGGMMGMMGRMTGMMDQCQAMMGGDARSDRPNEQWRNRNRSMPDHHE